MKDLCRLQMPMFQGSARHQPRLCELSFGRAYRRWCYEVETEGYLRLVVVLLVAASPPYVPGPPSSVIHVDLSWIVDNSTVSLPCLALPTAESDCPYLVKKVSRTRLH